MDPIFTLSLLLIYGVCLFLVYKKGENDTKRRYSELINRLHKQYMIEMNDKPAPLFDLDNIEDF